ncbi:MAG TPA: hypothetical protein VFB38_00890 [Chthonomonadaceae bacterium]|nr:hypothetical protein [Chthonomonadaceae bacterium]
MRLRPFARLLPSWAVALGLLAGPVLPVSAQGLRFRGMSGGFRFAQRPVFSGGAFFRPRFSTFSLRFNTGGFHFGFHRHFHRHFFSYPYFDYSYLYTYPLYTYSYYPFYPFYSEPYSSYYSPSYPSQTTYIIPVPIYLGEREAPPRSVGPRSEERQAPAPPSTEPRSEERKTPPPSTEPGPEEESDYYLYKPPRRSAVPSQEPGLKQAISEIETAFRNGDIVPLERHILPTKTLTVTARGRAPYSLTGRAYLDQTRAAFKEMGTVRYDLDQVEPAGENAWSVSGTHVLRSKEGKTQQFRVGFVLKKQGDTWIITEASAAPIR